MQRKDRAKIIRDKVMAEIEQHGEWTEMGGARYRKVETGKWGALLLTPFATFHKKPEAQNETQALYLQEHYSAPMGYQIDVWNETGKLVSFEWSDGGEPRIISMKRGAWEQELFGLPS